MGRYKLTLDEEVRGLRQQVYNMTHYWKIRCAERGTLKTKYGNVIDIMEKLNKTYLDWARMFNRKNFSLYKNHSHEGDKVYPLFLSHKQYCKLLNYLNMNKKYKYVTRKPGRRIPQLTKEEHSRLKVMLRKDRRLK